MRIYLQNWAEKCKAAIANCKKQFAGVYAQVTIVLCPRLSVLRVEELGVG